MKESDITGRRFGRLTALRSEGPASCWQIRWVCRCDCGNEVSVFKNHLLSGQTRSCGCLRRDMMKGNNRRYGSTVEQKPEE
jgi:hypothetical protein